MTIIQWAKQPKVLYKWSFFNFIVYTRFSVLHFQDAEVAKGVGFALVAVYFLLLSCMTYHYWVGFRKKQA